MNDFIKIRFSKSFIRGASRVFDMGASLKEYRISANPWEQDCRALRRDWDSVGRYIEEATKKYGEGYVNAFGNSV